MSIKIFQTFHKDFPHNEKCSWIKPIGVNGYKNPNFLLDSTGDNKSWLNSYYCELTAQYWVWKNDKSDYVGFYHYRRYLNYIIDSTWKSLYSATSCTPLESNINYLTSSQQLSRMEDILKLVDVITPTKSILFPSIKDQYLNCVEHTPWFVFIERLKHLYPQNHHAISLFELSPYSTICNMFVMKRSIFESYCNDLFNVIDHVYQEIGTPYDDYNNRYPGFLSERFLGFWLHIKNVKTFEVPMIMLD